MGHPDRCARPTRKEAPGCPPCRRSPNRAGIPQAPALSGVFDDHLLLGPASTRGYPPAGPRYRPCPDARPWAPRPRRPGSLWAPATAHSGVAPTVLETPPPSRVALACPGPWGHRDVHRLQPHATHQGAGCLQGGSHAQWSPAACFCPHAAPQLCPPSAGDRRASAPHPGVFGAQHPHDDGPLHAPDRQSRRPGT